MPRGTTIAAGLLLAALACGQQSDAPDLARCRELEPRITAEAAWDDIGGLEDDVTEWLARGCEELLADR